VATTKPNTCDGYFLTLDRAVELWCILGGGKEFQQESIMVQTGATKVIEPAPRLQAAALALR